MFFSFDVPRGVLKKIEYYTGLDSFGKIDQHKENTG